MKPTRRAVLLSPLALAVPVPAVAQEQDALAALLEEEYAAIHLYGVLGAKLGERARDVARAAYDDHRRHRDLLLSLVEGTPPAPKLSYPLRAPVASAAAALRLAVDIEDAMTVRWHNAFGAVAAPDRAACASAYADEAAHLARWRLMLSGPARATTAFPGR